MVPKLGWPKVSCIASKAAGGIDLWHFELHPGRTLHRQALVKVHAKACMLSKIVFVVVHPTIWREGGGTAEGLSENESRHTEGLS